MDFILVLEDGVLVETGTHDELYNKERCLFSTDSGTGRNDQMKLFQTYIIPYLKQYNRSILLAIFFAMITVFRRFYAHLYIWILNLASPKRPENILMIYVPVVLVRTFGISRAVTHYLERLAGHNAVLKILSQMRVKLYGVLEPQALFIRSRFQTGDLLDISR